MPRFPRALFAAVVLGAALLAPTAAAPPPTVGLGPLPACRLDDILTTPRGYDDWSITLVDWILSVGPDYKPPDLVSISGAGVTGGGQIRRVAFDDLEAMADAARAHGTPLGNVSAYRSYKTQKALFNSYAKGYGFNEAIKFSARPGHSEHQLGLAIDFAAAGTTTFVSSASGAGRWLANNAWKFGWLLSYPKGKRSVVCYRYEPWHYRYVGRDLAAKIHASGLTTREYLWANYTTAEVPTGSPGASASPSPEAASPTGPAPTAHGSSPSAAAPGNVASPIPTPVRTAPPSSPTGSWFGMDPRLVIVAAVLALVSMAVLARAVMRGRRPGRHRKTRGGSR